MPISGYISRVKKLNKMGKPSFDPTSEGSQRFLLRLLKHLDISTGKIDMDALITEEGITRKSVIQKLTGIKAALAKGQEMGDAESPPSSFGTPTKKRKPSVASSPAGKKIKTKNEEVEANTERKDHGEPDAATGNIE
ncbi:hypothetical protein Dda_3963 [Drechslerella dactyloides]|uniref:Uncharacterized protein n=1 Tax=Drechslerella dactyloides TaxID=74499 RepID=A0AAD6NK05_DREDA|nr:hypothetical protein Dda_3963 [Drechslerella dactyloides]